MAHSEGKGLFRVLKQGKDSKVPAGHWTLDYTSAVPASRTIIYIDLMLVVGVFTAKDVWRETNRAGCGRAIRNPAGVGKPCEPACGVSEEVW